MSNVREEVLDEFSEQLQRVGQRPFGATPKMDPKWGAHILNLEYFPDLGGEHPLEPLEVVALRVGVVQLQRVDRVPVVQRPQDHLFDGICVRC